MAVQFFDLPLEIRLKIYAVAFGKGTVVLDGGRQDAGAEVNCPSLLPGMAVARYPQQRSGQLLRVCKTILYEARPVLYANTRFQTLVQAFAGRLPSQFTAGHPSAALVRHLTWQLSCDLLKQFTVDDVHMEEQNLVNMQTIELRCQAESWKGSFYGEWCDRNAFERGRNSMIQLAKLIKNKMEEVDKSVSLEEDETYSGQGKVCLRLTKLRRPFNQTVLIC